MEKKEAEQLIVMAGGGVLCAAMIGGLIAAGGVLYKITDIIHPTTVVAEAQAEPHKETKTPPPVQPARSTHPTLSHEAPKPAPVRPNPTNGTVNVAVIDYRMIMTEMPEIQQLNKDMDEAYKQIQEDAKALDEKARNDFFMKRQEDLMKMEQERFNPIKQRIDDTIEAVMERHELAGALSKDVMIRGGVDITEEVKAELGM